MDAVLHFLKVIKVEEVKVGRSYSRAQGTYSGGWVGLSSISLWSFAFLANWVGYFFILSLVLSSFSLFTCGCVVVCLSLGIQGTRVFYYVHGYSSITIYRLCCIYTTDKCAG